MSKTSFIVNVIVAGVSAALASHALAQEKLALEEIVVTAQKRDQSLQEIPVAIDNFSADSLTKSGVQDLVDLSKVSSSFSMNTGGGTGQPFIRGVGSSVVGSGTYGSSSVYIDGAYVPRGYSLVAGAGMLNDVESVQVLKGPQGSLYGRNATGGAVIISTETPRPEDEFEGYIKGALGNYSTRNFSVGISGGMTDNLAGSLAYTSHQHDGYVKNLAGGQDLDDADGFGVTGKLFLQLDDTAEFTLSARYTEDKMNSYAFQQIGQTDSWAAAGTPFEGLLNNPQMLWFGTASQVYQVLTGTSMDAGQLATLAGLASQITFSNTIGEGYNNQAPGAHVTGVLPAGNIGNKDAGGYYEDLFVTLNSKFFFDKFDLVSVTFYNDHIDETTAEVFRANPNSLPDFTATFGLEPYVAGLAAATGLPITDVDKGTLGFSAIFDTKAYSQELYLVSTDSAIEWIAGIYYFHEEGSTLLPQGPFGIELLYSDNDWQVDSQSVFAEATAPLTDDLKLTLGTRYTDEDYELVDHSPLTNAGKIEQSNSKTTVNGRLTYFINDDWMVYGGYSTGFKSGSLNAQDPSAGSVGPEEIDSYEVGFKSTLADGSLRLNGSLFTYDYSNIQLNVLDPQTGVTVLVDGVGSDISGAELGAEWVASDNLKLNGTVTYLDSEYTSDAAIPTAGITQAIKGNKLVMTPDTVIALGADYHVPWVTEGQLTLIANVNYNSGFFIDQLNTFGSGGDEDNSFTTVNLNATYESPAQDWLISLYANNITDEKYFRGGIDAAGSLSQLGTAGKPRTYGVTAEYRF